jgi:DNA-binding transcriptional ArsR family regulator
VVDALTALAEPTRRRIVEQLRQAECTVGDLVERLAISQPGVSKHLRVLREAGVVTVRTAAQQRIYRLEPGPFRQLDAWLAPYRKLWTGHLDALAHHLDQKTSASAGGLPTSAGSPSPGSAGGLPASAGSPSPGSEARHLDRKEQR